VRIPYLRLNIDSMRVAIFKNEYFKKVSLCSVDGFRRDLECSLEPRRDPEAHRNRLQLFHDTPIFQRIVNAQASLSNRWLTGVLFKIAVDCGARVPTYDERRQ
jgi:hypothetical protein